MNSILDGTLQILKNVILIKAGYFMLIRYLIFSVMP